MLLFILWALEVAQEQLHLFLDWVALPEVGFLELFSSRFWLWLASQWRLLIPAFAGSLALSFILAALAYPLALWFIKRFRAIRRGG